MKEDMSVADKMVLLVLRSSARSVRNCARSAPERTYSQSMVAKSEGLQWKLAWRRTWALPTLWHCWFWDRGHAAHVIARKVHQNTLICCLWWLEVKDFNENQHEGGHGGCQENDFVKFWIAHAERVILRKARQTLLFAVYHGWKWGIAMKVDLKEDMDVANKMTSNLVSGSMRNYTHRDDIHNGITPKRTYFLAVYGAIMEGLWWKFAWRRTWALSMKWHHPQLNDSSLCRGLTSASFLGRKLWLEWSDLDKSLHEGGHGRCRWNCIVRFGITQVQQSKRAKTHLLTVYFPCTYYL